MNFKNGLTLSLGLRFDNYNGLSKGNSLQPRARRFVSFQTDKHDYQSFLYAQF